MPVKFHIASGARYSFRRGSRESLTVIADVTGLSGNEGRMLIDAARHPQMIRPGDGHPTLPGFSLSTIDGEIVGPGHVRFALGFEERPGVTIRTRTRNEETTAGLIQIGASLTSVTTGRDINGDPITVSYRNSSGITTTQNVEVEMPLSAATRRIERVETSPNLSLPDEYNGTVNTRSIWGRNARTLLCREISFVSRDGGSTWLASYEFAYKADTWDSNVVFRDPVTGKAKAGVLVGNGIETKRVITERDFSRIGVRFPST